MITCEKLTTHYVPALDRPILREIDLNIVGGEFIGLLGLNGAGKSTLLRSWVGLVPIAQGSVTIKGQLLSPKAVGQQEISMLFQGGGLVRQLPVLDNVLCGCLGARSPWKTLWGFEPSDRQRAMDLLDQLGLADQRFRKTGLLSGGQQQRVAIARALMQSPQILLVDEPTTGLDVQATVQVMEILKGLQGQGLTIVAILHDLGLVEGYCDRAIVLEKGRVKYDGVCAHLQSHLI